MSYAIDFINTTVPSVVFTNWDELDDAVEELTERFETEFADDLRGCDSDDVGGLIVYTNAGDVRAVYDYENFCGWLA